MPRCGCQGTCSCCVTAGTGIAVVGTGVGGNCFEVSLTGGAVFVADTDCIDLEGDGSIGDPITAEPIIPVGAVVPHPAGFGLPDTINGIACSPTGFMAPQPGFPFFSASSLPFGSNPDIVANTGGQITWGPVLSDTLTNPNSDRVMLANYVTQFPYTTMVLEPGAIATVGVIVDPLGLAIYLPIWSMTNASGAAVESYSSALQTFVSVHTLIFPSALNTVDGQMFVELSGATGLSSVTTVGQAGLSIQQFGVPF